MRLLPFAEENIHNAYTVSQSYQSIRTFGKYSFSFDRQFQKQSVVLRSVLFATPET